MARADASDTIRRRVVRMAELAGGEITPAQAELLLVSCEVLSAVCREYLVEHGMYSVIKGSEGFKRQ